MLKSEVKDVESKEELLEDRIERERRALTTRTPVTLDRLQEWLKQKQERKELEEEKCMEEAKQNYAKGKRPVISGRALFAIDPSLFIDDDGAGDDVQEREAVSDDDDGADDERKGVDFTPLAGPSAAEWEARLVLAAAERELADAEKAKEVAAAKEAEFAKEVAAFAAAKAAKQASSADGAGAGNGHAEGAAGEAPAAAVSSSDAKADAERPADLAASDLDGVDASLFLDEDFDDADIE